MCQRVRVRMCEMCPSHSCSPPCPPPSFPPATAPFAQFEALVSSLQHGSSSAQLEGAIAGLQALRSVPGAYVPFLCTVASCTFSVSGACLSVTNRPIFPRTLAFSGVLTRWSLRAPICPRPLSCPPRSTGAGFPTTPGPGLCKQGWRCRVGLRVCGPLPSPRASEPSFESYLPPSRPWVPHCPPPAQPKAHMMQSCPLFQQVPLCATFAERGARAWVQRPPHISPQSTTPPPPRPPQSLLGIAPRHGT
jgi:hypothetical protein